MSRYSGRCDLYDHIYMIGQNDKTSMRECFDEFKKATKGQIYQYYPFKLTRWNIEREADLNPALVINRSTKRIPDKRTKLGYREVNADTYTYWFKEYKSIDELNKHGYCGIRIIKFDDMLDLIPYYDYVIASCACSPDSQIVYLASESENTERERSWRENGFETDDLLDDRRKAFKEAYIKLITSGEYK